MYFSDFPHIVQQQGAAPPVAAPPVAAQLAVEVEGGPGTAEAAPAPAPLGVVGPQAQFPANYILPKFSDTTIAALGLKPKNISSELRLSIVKSLFEDVKKYLVDL